MNVVSAAVRWGTIYDAEGLAQEIRALVGRADFAASFYDISKADPAVCQGDIVELRTAVPFLDENGQPAATEYEYCYWLVLGNTCDFDRDLASVPWTQVVPIQDHGPVAGVPEQTLSDLRHFAPSRVFYIPPWCSDVSDRCLCADLTRFTHIDKRVFQGPARVVARMSRLGWAVLHSCVVRFLARDDGRFDSK